jgi:uncharacterized circularly permuted ATP-grasp superfamily protein/uncharacterized alpha-E superfamily protein
MSEKSSDKEVGSKGPPGVKAGGEMSDMLKATKPAGAPWLLEQYQQSLKGYDELMLADGTLRPHYRHFLEDLGRFNRDDLKHRHDIARRIVHEQGITYNVYGDVRGMERPWQLDPVPAIISSEEWQTLETALIQRATLINKVLGDCYGRQDLIRSGWMPPALVFAQPDFLRACHGVKPPQDTFLHLYAADLARSPDGRWWVISDRTQIPTGSGYALANRLVTSRVLPESFRDCQVQRLAGFFRDLQTSLSQLASRRTDNPRVVLLTPGPYNETYFEQGYLARYLGYSMVEGQDLMVRDNRVFLKTLSGLEPVDVILRRVDDDFCDPLELRNDSMLGVPGLAEAARAGNVAIANALGSGLLQSPAFMAFLPGLCKHLLDEELKIPSIATWWCGQKKAEEYVLEHLDDLFVKPAFRSHLKGMTPDRVMTSREREELRRRIAIQPHLFVGQERVQLSTTPTWNGEKLVPSPMGLRVYLVATPDGYKVMPGGLVRVASSQSGRFITMQKGGSSKDVWILSDKPVSEVSLLHSMGQAVDLRRVGNNLPSRLADNFFWLGRYCERADSSARLLRSALNRFNPESTGSTLPVLLPLLQTLESQGQLVTAPPEQKTTAETLEAELLAAIFDAQRAGSLRRIADHLQRLATLLRDRTSNDVWRVLSEVDDRLTLPASSPVILAGDAIGVLNQTVIGLAAFNGLARENMTKAQGWRFIDIGLRIERSIYLCTLLRNALRSPEAENPSVLEAILEVADNTITYRSRYNLLPNIAAVFDLLILDDTNPHSLIFQLSQLQKHFDRLPIEKQSALLSVGERVLLECSTRVRLMDPQELANFEGDREDSQAMQVLTATLNDLPRLSEAIAVSYFAHSTIARAGGKRA